MKGLGADLKSRECDIGQKPLAGDVSLKSKFSSAIYKTEGGIFQFSSDISWLKSLRNDTFNIIIAALYLKQLQVSEYVQWVPLVLQINQRAIKKKKVGWLISGFVLLRREMQSLCLCAAVEFQGLLHLRGELWTVTHSLDPMSTRSAHWSSFNWSHFSDLG